MLAIVRDGSRDPAVALADVDEPTAAPDEAIVAVRASSVNRGELALLAARPDGWRPGQDVAGVVVEPAASGDGPAAGTRVVGLAEGAAWSERVAVPVARLASIDQVSFDVAATLGIAGLTALRTVRLAGPMLGRRVLILGAGGGIGQLLVQLAAGAGGRVTAMVRTAARATPLVELGAADVKVGDDPETATFDIVIDGVGGASLERAVRAVRPGGVIVLIGASDPEPARIALTDFIGHEGARILTFFSYASGDESAVGNDLATLAELVAQRRLRPAIGRTLDWHRLDELLVAMAAGEVVGKAILTVA